MTITILGEPKGQPRPRAYARKMGAKYVARVYDSDVADLWKHAVDLAIIAALQNGQSLPDHGSPFKVRMMFVMPRPKSHRRSNGQLKPNAPKYHTQKPDSDNLAKLVLDRITRSGCIWSDDSQVCECEIVKLWQRDGGDSGAIITLQTLVE